MKSDNSYMRNNSSSNSNTCNNSNNSSTTCRNSELQRFCADKDLHVWGLAVSDLGLRVPGGLSL